MIARHALVYFFIVILVAGAAAHVVVPDVFGPLVPPGVPLGFANWTATVVEGTIAVLLGWPRFRRLGALGFTALMMVYLPLHVWDLTKEEPLVGSTGAAAVRLAVQLALIGLGLWVARGLAPSAQRFRTASDPME